MGVPLEPPNRKDEAPIVRTMPHWPARLVVRVLLIVIAFGISIYLVYLLRKPIGWVLIATFLAVAL